MVVDVGAERRGDERRAQAERAADDAGGDDRPHHGVLFDGRDLTADARVSVYLKNGRAATMSGQTAILTLPIHNYANPPLIADLEADTNRVFPIAVNKVVGPHAEMWRLTVTLPEGWRARLPEGVSVRGRYGEYEARYTQQGRTLEVVRRLSGTGEGIEPPERIGDLIAWLKAVARDDVPYVVLERSP